MSIHFEAFEKKKDKRIVVISVRRKVSKPLRGRGMFRNIGEYSEDRKESLNMNNVIFSMPLHRPCAVYNLTACTTLVFCLQGLKCCYSAALLTRSHFHSYGCRRYIKGRSLNNWAHCPALLEEHKIRRAVHNVKYGNIRLNATIVLWDTD